MNKLQSVAESDAARYARIVKIVQWVENMKQIHLSDDERRALAVSLNNQPEPIEKILEWAKNVVKTKDFRAITLDMFLNSETLYSSAEIEMIFEHRIQKRRDEYIRLKIGSMNEEEFARQGLIDVQIWWSGKIREQIRKHAERIDKKCKRLQAQFYLLPDQAKLDLWQKAVAKGIVQNEDPHWELILPMLVPQMMVEFDEIIRNNSQP